jgi:hypothetical protein
MTVLEAIERETQRLPDDALIREFQCTQDCILRLTRCRRDLAIMRMKAIRREMERRGFSQTTIDQAELLIRHR